MVELLEKEKAFNDETQRTQRVTVPASRGDWRRLDGVDVLWGVAILFVLLNYVHMRLLIAGIPYVSKTGKPLVAAVVLNGSLACRYFSQCPDF
jgi:hypothetical protein